MEFSGRVIAILPARTGVSKSTGNEWKVQSYVVENHDQYPRRMCFEVFGGDKIDQFNIQMGEEINVSFDIDARQWQDKWFNGKWRECRKVLQRVSQQLSRYLHLLQNLPRSQVVRAIRQMICHSNSSSPTGCLSFDRQLCEQKKTWCFANS